MELFYIILYSVLGLVIGSFLNVVIYRVPAGQSIATPRSHCPNCGHFLRSWELIPVLSYLFLKGRCSKCQQKISWRYSVVELLTAMLFILAFFFRPGRTMSGLFLDFIFISLLIALTFIDIDTFRLPDVLVILVAAVGVINALVTKEPVIWQSLLGAVIAGGVFFLISYFYAKGMGFGDVKFVAALGLYLGAPEILAAIFFASLLGAISGGLSLLVNKKSLKDPIPFGPFLAAGALIMFLFQHQLFQFYYSIT